jgi:large subunit ribosomal protein L31
LPARGYLVENFSDYEDTGMKKKFHPELYEITAHCACGNDVKTRSTQKEIRATLCGACHPFYTGDQKFVDTAGRIDKFNKKFGQIPVAKK